MATITKDLGPVTAYKYAVSKGYTGTEEQFAQLMADLVLMPARLDEVEDDVEQAEGKVNSLDDDVTVLENTVTSQGTRISTLEGKTSPKQISLTATAGTNCGYVTVNQAYVSAGVLYVKFTVRPVAGLTSANDNVDFTISNITPAIKPDWRIGFGVIGHTYYGAWIADASGTIRCRRMDGSIWSSDSTSVIFGGVIPLAS